MGLFTWRKNTHLWMYVLVSFVRGKILVDSYLVISIKCSDMPLGQSWRGLICFIFFCCSLISGMAMLTGMLTLQLDLFWKLVFSACCHILFQGYRHCNWVCKCSVLWVLLILFRLSKFLMAKWVIISFPLSKWANGAVSGAIPK